MCDDEICNTVSKKRMRTAMRRECVILRGIHIRLLFCAMFFA